jgi:hypothetical protein
VADPTAASRDEAADTQRQALLASSRDRAAQIGESTGGYLRGVTAASELGRQADVRGIRNTIAETRSKVRDLKREKGDFRVARAGEKRGEERDWNIQNRTLSSNNRNAAAGRALDWATENRLGREANNSGSGGMTPSERRDARKDRQEARQERRQSIQEGIAAIRLQIKDANDPAAAIKTFSDPGYLYNWLVEKKDVEPAIARVVARRWRKIVNKGKNERPYEDRYK